MRVKVNIEWINTLITNQNYLPSLPQERNLFLIISTPTYINCMHLPSSNIIIFVFHFEQNPLTTEEYCSLRKVHCLTYTYGFFC